MTDRSHYQEDMERLQRLRPIDDDFMRCMFRDNDSLFQMVIQIILQIDNIHMIKVETQKDLKRLAGARSLCLDVFGIDSAGVIYDLEVERSDKGADPFRARYHSSCMDVEHLRPKQDFEELPETYVIFLTEKDYFGEEKPVYYFERGNRENVHIFEDCSHIVYVNGEFRDDSSIGRLMHDFSCSNPRDMYYQEMREAAQYYKENPEGVRKMCKIFDEIREEGRQEGREESILRDIRNVMETLKVSAGRAMEVLRIPAGEQEKYAARL